MAAVLKESQFDPRKPGRFNAILEDGQPWEVYLARAKEFLREAEALAGVEADARIRDAISLLAYGRTVLQDGT